MNGRPTRAQITAMQKLQHNSQMVSKTALALKTIADFKASCTQAIAIAQAAGKPVSALTEFERLGLMFLANVPVTYDGHTFRYEAEVSDLNDDGVVDGAYHIKFPHQEPAG